MKEKERIYVDLGDIANIISQQLESRGFDTEFYYECNDLGAVYGVRSDYQANQPCEIQLDLGKIKVESYIE